MAFDGPQPSAVPVQSGGISARVAPVTDVGRKTDAQRRQPPDFSPRRQQRSAKR